MKLRHLLEQIEHMGLNPDDEVVLKIDADLASEIMMTKLDYDDFETCSGEEPYEDGEGDDLFQECRHHGSCGRGSVVTEQFYELDVTITQRVTHAWDGTMPRPHAGRVVALVPTVDVSAEAVRDGDHDRAQARWDRWVEEAALESASRELKRRARVVRDACESIHIRTAV